jgi:hypothetical protein
LDALFAPFPRSVPPHELFAEKQKQLFLQKEAISLATQLWIYSSNGMDAPLNLPHRA